LLVCFQVHVSYLKLSKYLVLEDLTKIHLLLIRLSPSGKAYKGILLCKDK
jgi:hypothetical protein